MKKEQHKKDPMTKRRILFALQSWRADIITSNTPGGVNSARMLKDRNIIEEVNCIDCAIKIVQGSKLR